MESKNKTTSKPKAEAKQEKPKMPRGFRNCNPLNIVRRDAWIGLADKQNDPKFCVFIAMKYGFRAALILLRRYINGYHLNTICAIVNRWAPDGPNAVANYVAVVSKHMGVHPHAPLSFANRQQMTLLLEGMTKAECGRLPQRSDIEDAFEIL